MNKIVIALILSLLLVGCGKSVTPEKKAEDKIVKKDDVEVMEDNPEYTDVDPGHELTLATLKIMVSGMEELHGNEKSKIVKVTLTLTNITKAPFDFTPINIIDGQDRGYEPYEESYLFDDNLQWKTISPDLEVTGSLYYEVPLDSTDFRFHVSDANTGDAYKLIVK